MAWKIIKEKTASHWLQMVRDDCFSKCSVKFDGCIHYNKIYNTSYNENGEYFKPEDSECEDYIHICDIDDMIKQLQEIKAMALAHFGDKWE